MTRPLAICTNGTVHNPDRFPMSNSLTVI
jgi:hypothetical protein